jgi:peptide/nickel transport system ATP-binding protein
VLDALTAARARTRAALLLVTHDLTVVAGHADRVLVMYAGRVVESATVDDLFANARMPYTRTLLAAARFTEPTDPPAAPAAGDGSPARPPATAGCAFAPHCRRATEVCHEEVPALRMIGRHTHLAACHHAEDVQ